MNNRNPSRPPALDDVARLAGVSVSTVARVLRESSYPVNPELRDRVRKAAAELGYMPNLIARSLRGGNATTVGLVVGDIMDPFYGEVAAAVTRHAETTHSILAIVCNMQRDPLLEIRYCRKLWQHRVGGLILTGGGFDQWSHMSELSELIPQIVKSGVTATTLSPRGLPVEEFSVDNRLAGEMAARLLIEKGHQRVGIILGRIQNQVTQQRLSGITELFSRNGVNFYIVHTDHSAASGAEAADQLLKSFPGITGIIAGSYLTAITAMGRLSELGKSVPRDISVVSIGGVSVPQFSRFDVTGIDIRLAQRGLAALDFIAARMQGRPEAPRTTFEPQIIPGSTLDIPLSTS